MHNLSEKKATPAWAQKPFLPLADQLLEAGLNASKMPAILFSPEDEIAYMSDAYRDLVGAPAHAETLIDLIQYWHDNQCGPQMHGSLEERIAATVANRRSIDHRTFEISLVNGRWFLVNETVIAGGWIWNFLTDITSFKATEQELVISRDLARQDAETDALTGIFNRRFALDELEASLKISQKTGHPLTIAIIDLDHFKSINDNFGHDAGDETLSHFALTSSWLLRRTDTLARFGGEEFLLIMPGANADDTRAIIERIRREIVEHPMIDPIIDYTFSCGIAAFKDGTAKSLLKRADQALYQAKAEGRNRTCEL